MNINTEIPLILGGHSFISQLGNDEGMSYSEQIEIVNTCLENGVNWFDTTYQPERIALGKILEETGKRDQAHIIVWNFFNDFKPEEAVGGASYYQSGHMDILLEQLRTSYLDAVVVHALDNEEENLRQQELAESWLSKGYVKKLGIWCPKANDYLKYANKNKYSFMVHPFNITTKNVDPVFDMSKNLGWQIFACSPFVRGWELDKLVRKAFDAHGNDKKNEGENGENRENTVKNKEIIRDEVADLLLRYSLYEKDIDKLIVAMRNKDWVQQNIDSVKKGPLSKEEKKWLENLLIS